MGSKSQETKSLHKREHKKPQKESIKSCTEIFAYTAKASSFLSVPVLITCYQSQQKIQLFWFFFNLWRETIHLLCSVGPSCSAIMWYSSWPWIGCEIIFLIEPIPIFSVLSLVPSHSWSASSLNVKRTCSTQREYLQLMKQGHLMLPINDMFPCDWWVLLIR